MLTIYAVTVLILGALALAVFYLIVRTRDIGENIAKLNEKLFLSDDMRKQASETIANLNEKMGSLNQKASQIRDVMTEVTNLRNLFIMPKRAGGAGERLLEKALRDVLPSEMVLAQYSLSPGPVDFVVKFRDYLVPIDSKLSLENFNRMLAATEEPAKKTFWKAFTGDVKRRIDETARYILPGEKTTDFALMYIASESVYYEAFVKDTNFGENNVVLDYALKKKVYPVSPQTIYPYLMTILQGMKALRIEENAKEILGKVGGLRNDFERFKVIYAIIIDHLNNARKKHDNEAQGALTKVDHHISSLEQKSR
ncbi:MAG: DNA recombination protein RmuC [Candidatus Omnitrophota bacterium]